MTIQLLPNTHVSPETAYVVDDYPYGFRLRCKIRYWLDISPKHGARLMSQTSNPKVAGLVWNKPKGSTYCKFAGAMYLDENNHVQWTGLHEYVEHEKVAPWIETYGAAVPESIRDRMNMWAKAVTAYAARRSTGQDMATAAAGALVETVSC